MSKQDELWSALEEKYGGRPEPPSVAATVVAVADSVVAVPSFFNWGSSSSESAAGGDANGDDGLGASDGSSSDGDASSDDEVRDLEYTVALCGLILSLTT